MTNGERIRAAHDALNAGDPYPFLELYHPEVEMYVPGWAVLEPGVIRGASEVERWYGHYMAQWQDARYEIEQLHEWGPHVVVFGHWRAAGRRSRIPLESIFLTVFSFEDGRIVSIAQLGGAEITRLDRG